MDFENIILCPYCGDNLDISIYELHVYLCETTIRQLIDLHQVTQYNQLLELGERLGNVQVSIDVDKVSTKIQDNINVCPICLESDNIEKRKLNCSHIFCDSCITTWLNKSKKCPICITDLEDTTNILNIS